MFPPPTPSPEVGGGGQVADLGSALQVVGHKEGLDVMERADPLFLLIGLPTIPVMLILGKMIRWEDYVLRLWRKYSSKLQILNSIFPGPSAGPPRCRGDAGKNSSALTPPLSCACPQGSAARFPASPPRPARWRTTCPPPGSCVALWSSPPSPPSWGSSCSAASTPTCRGPSW